MSRLRSSLGTVVLLALVVNGVVACSGPYPDPSCSGRRHCTTTETTSTASTTAVPAPVPTPDPLVPQATYDAWAHVYEPSYQAFVTAGTQYRARVDQITRTSFELRSHRSQDYRTAAATFELFANNLERDVDRAGSAPTALHSTAWIFIGDVKGLYDVAEAKECGSTEDCAATASDLARRIEAIMADHDRMLRQVQPT